MYVILHMSVITQKGYSLLMYAAKGGRTEAVVELVKSGADLNLQNKVCHMYIPLVSWSEVELWQTCSDLFCLSECLWQCHFLLSQSRSMGNVAMYEEGN